MENMTFSAINKEADTVEDMVYTVEETAAILRTTKDYVYKLIKTGALKTIKLPQFKIRKITLEQFLETWEGYDLSNPTDPTKM